MIEVLIDGESLKIEDVIRTARHYTPVAFDPERIVELNNQRVVLEDSLKKKISVYGVNTGFGSLHKIRVSEENLSLLQKNLIMSHSVGVGDPFPEEVVRAILLLRANTLIKGYSGVRPQLVNLLVEMLNKGIHPVIPEKGSVGASGDLAPLAHMALVMIGDEAGEAFYQGQRMSGKDAMKAARITLIELKAKEGLALINGTAVMTAIGALNVYDAESLLKIADTAGAMSLEAIKGLLKPFDKRVQDVRPHRGQAICAENIRLLTNGSRLCSFKSKDKVHDAYSIRCIPQVHGASRDAISFVKNIIEIEINSATDNPLFFADKSESFSVGNFHGQHVAIAMDTLAIALTTLGNISERRIARLINKNLSGGLPAFLIDPSKLGLHSGFMLAQYTAAALTSENKASSHPASVDSIPTSAGFEDHVSMGTIAARKAREILRNVQNILAIELLCASQAIDLRASKEGSNAEELLGRGTKETYREIRKVVRFLDQDRVLSEDIEKVLNLIESGRLLLKVSNFVKLE